MMIKKILVSSLFLLLLWGAKDLAATPAGDPVWTYEKYTEAVKKSGRKMDMTKEQFAEVQKRKEAALDDISKFLVAMLRKAHPEVLEAFRQVPREYFQFDYQRKSSF